MVMQARRQTPGMNEAKRRQFFAELGIVGVKEAYSTVATGGESGKCGDWPQHIR
jgi:hypothetical protein